MKFLQLTTLQIIHMVGVSAEKLCLSDQPAQKQFHDLSPVGKKNRIDYSLPCQLIFRIWKP